ncbi:MAG: acyl-[acyl-carrier-protein]--UDP-N-acetylglucosamine O-acyltransferase, partial [Limnohabitans sp.]
KAMYKALYRENLTLEAAKLRMATIAEQTPQAQPDVQRMLDFLSGVGKPGIVRRRARSAA